MTDENTPSSGVLGPITGIDPDAVQDSAAGQQSLGGAQYFGSQVSHDGQDPPYITRMELFEGLSHEEIFAKVDEMEPGAMHSVADDYRSIANSLGGGLLGSLLSIQRELSDGVDGQFADAANQAARRFFDQATDVQEVINSVGMRIKSAAFGAEVVKKSVPPPPTQAPTGDTAVTTSVVDPMKVAETVVGATDPAAAAAFAAYKEDQRLIAVAAMNTGYKPTYQPAGEGVPTFVPVQGPGDEPGPTGPSGTTTNGPGGTTSGPGSQAQNGENPGQNETGEQPQETPGSAEEPQVTTASSTENPTTTQQPGTTPGSPAGDPQRTTSSTTMPGSPGVPTGTPGSPGMPGGAPPQIQAPGKTVPGAPGGTPNGPAGGPAAAAGTSRAMSGMPGMMGGGAGVRRSEDDEEHKVPDYLVHDREEELFGVRTQLLDGVLGGDAPAAQPADDRGDRR